MAQNMQKEYYEVKKKVITYVRLIIWNEFVYIINYTEYLKRKLRHYCDSGVQKYYAILRLKCINV
jgi:hypothetical protein